ncbi:unnamed protein product [Protopolystoma xenopodis]|uniref:Uncharacterized protein n=1 Tax=Protopolystoma xenopodis TaxID=117903 RepID=A0A448X485_9PLAT|nr:unnamed protein product [Protopolystoma xenopodis]
MGRRSCGCATTSRLRASELGGKKRVEAVPSERAPRGTSLTPQIRNTEVSDLVQEGSTNEGWAIHVPLGRHQQHVSGRQVVRARAKG